MDGQATMAALLELNPNVRIIATSGLRASGRVAQAVAAGQVAWLPKPYTDQQILAALAAVLTREEGERGWRKTTCSSSTTTR
jgi:CheY-like chemotaxis protein